MAAASGVVCGAWPVGGGGSAGGGAGTCGGGAPGCSGSPGGSGSAGAGFVASRGVRRDDLDDRMVFREQVLVDGRAYLFGGDGEVALKLRVEQRRVAVVERVLGEPLRAIERGLAAAHGVVQKSVAQLLHLLGAGAFRPEPLDLLADGGADRFGRVTRLRDGEDVEGRGPAPFAEAALDADDRLLAP